MFAGALVTTAVAEDAAAAVPTPLLAATSTTTVEPTSDGASAYDEEFAPGIPTQLAPLASQSAHW